MTTSEAMFIASFFVLFVYIALLKIHNFTYFPDFSPLYFFYDLLYTVKISVVFNEVIYGIKG